MILRSKMFLRPLFVTSSFQFKNYSFLKKYSAVFDWCKSPSLFFKTSRRLPNLEDESNLPSTWRYIAPLKKYTINLDSSLSTHWYSANICPQANHTLFMRPLIRKGKHNGGSSFLKKSSPGKFAYTFHFQQIGINATKIEKTGIHFKTDVFAAVAVVDAKAP